MIKQIYIRFLICTICLIVWHLPDVKAQVACFNFVGDSIGCAPCTVNIRSCVEPGGIYSLTFNYGKDSLATVPPNVIDTSFIYTEPGTFIIKQFRGPGKEISRTVRVYSQASRPSFTWSTCLDTLKIQMNDSLFSAFKFNSGDGVTPETDILGGHTSFKFKYNFVNSGTFTFSIKGNLPGSCSKEPVLTKITLYKGYNAPPSDSLIGINTLTYRTSIQTKADQPYLYQLEEQGIWSNLKAGITDEDDPEQKDTLLFVTTKLNQKIRAATTTGCSDTLPAPDWTLLWPKIAPDNQKITLTWPLFSIPALLQFDILRDGIKIKSVSLVADTTFVDSSNLVCGQTYCYQFLMRREIAGHSGKLIYLSAPICAQAVSNQPPGPVNQITATVKEDGIEISGKASPLAKTFELFRREKESEEYIRLLQTNTLPIIDTNADFNNRAYCYRISYLDKCDNQSLLSDSICPVWLRMEVPNESEKRFFWTSMDGWKEGVQRYELFRYSVFDSPVTYDMGLNTSYNLEGRDKARQKITYYIKSYANRDSDYPVSISNKIEVIQKSQLRFPEVFTPNDDQVNDAFNCYTYFLSEYEMKVFNAWGEIVYQTDRLKEGWDGKIDSKPAASGVYAYWAKGTDEEGNMLETRGYFTLVR